MQVCWSILKKNVRLSKHSWSGLGSPCLSIFQHAIWMWPSNVSLRFFEHSHVMLISSLWTRPPLHLGLKLLVHFELPHEHFYQLVKPSYTSHITWRRFWQLPIRSSFCVMVRSLRFAPRLKPIQLSSQN